MACERWKPEWIAHLYDELDDTEAAELERHVAECASCGQELASLRSSRRILEDHAPEVSGSPHVVIVEPTRMRRPIWAFAGGFAAAALLFVVGAVAGSYWARATSSGPAARTALAASDTRSPEWATRADVEAALQTRFAALEDKLVSQAPPTQPAVTREELDQAVQQLLSEFAQDQLFMMEEIHATEARAAVWAGQNREALRAVALQNDPRFRQH